MTIMVMTAREGATFARRILCPGRETSGRGPMVRSADVPEVVVHEWFQEAARQRLVVQTSLAVGKRLEGGLAYTWTSTGTKWKWQ